jgi:hypothetical protein
MRAARIALLLTTALGSVLAQDAAPSSAPAKPSDAMREARHREGLIATRAIAYFHSMDSIEENLNSLGVTLHPQLVSLRLRIEAGLNNTDEALEQGDFAAANENLDVAEGLLARLAAKLGG